MIHFAAVSEQLDKNKYTSYKDQLYLLILIFSITAHFRIDNIPPQDQRAAYLASRSMHDGPPHHWRSSSLELEVATILFMGTS